MSTADKQVQLQTDVIDVGGGRFLVMADAPGSLDLQTVEAYCDEDKKNRLIVRYPKKELVDANWAKATLTSQSWCCEFYQHNQLGRVPFHFGRGTSLYESLTNHMNKMNNNRTFNSANAAKPWIWFCVDFDKNIKSKVVSITDPRGVEIPGLSQLRKDSTKVLMVHVEYEKNGQGYVNTAFDDDQ